MTGRFLSAEAPKLLAGRPSSALNLIANLPADGHAPRGAAESIGRAARWPLCSRLVFSSSQLNTLTVRHVVPVFRTGYNGGNR